MAQGVAEAGTLSVMMNGDLGDRRALKALAMMPIGDAKAFCAEMARDNIGDVHAADRDPAEVLTAAKYWLEKWIDSGGKL